MSFVPEGFVVPEVPTHPDLLLEPLGVQHNEPDLAAWATSHDHIHATPGYEGYPWPPLEPFTLERNAQDLQMHADDWAAGTGFTFTVLDPVERDVIGCVYVYPGDDPAFDAHVRSWVRADKAPLDVELWRLVDGWLSAAWPFERVLYAARDRPPAPPAPG